MVVAVDEMTELCVTVAAFESADSAACVGWVVLRADSMLDGDC